MICNALTQPDRRARVLKVTIELVWFNIKILIRKFANRLYYLIMNNTYNRNLKLKRKLATSKFQSLRRLF